MGMEMNQLEEMGSTCGRDREMTRKREGFVSPFNYAPETQVPLEGIVVGEELVGNILSALELARKPTEQAMTL